MDLSSETIAGIKGWLDAIAAGMPGFTRRRVQDRAILAMATALEPTGDVSRLLAIEGPTGVGKSIAYLVAGLVAGRRHGKTLVISTATVALQQQLARDLARLAEIAPWKIRTNLLKGRGRYLCDRNLAHLAGEDPDQLGLDLGGEAAAGQWPFQPAPDERNAVASLRDSRASQAWDGDLDALSTPISKRLRPLLTTTARGCAGQACPYSSRCAVLRARSGVFDAEVVVVNHALLLADQAAGGGALLPALEDSILIVDEAHHLPDVAVDASASEMVLGGHAKRLAGAAVLIRKTVAMRGKDLKAAERMASAQEEIGGVLDHLGREMTRMLDTSGETSAPSRRYGRTYGRPVVVRLTASQFDGVRQEMADAAEEARWLMDLLEREKEKLTKEPPAGVKAGALAKMAKDLGEAGEWMHSVSSTLALLSQEDEQAGVPVARWVRRDGQGHVEVHACPVEASAWLADEVWGKAFGAVATSATLRALGDFRHFADRAGLSRISDTRYLALPSPFDLEAAAVLRVPAMVSEPSREDEYLAEVLIELEEAIDPAEATLVLCASAALMEALVERAPVSWRDVLLVQGSMAIGPLLDRHREAVAAGRGSILVGLASLAEGVDLPGKQCSHVVIVKIPFAAPNDPVGETRSEWLERHGRSAFAEILLPEAHRRMLQACGRLIRSEMDTGRITVLDRRLLTKPYGRRMLDTLPPYRRDTGVVVAPGRAA